MKRHAHTYRELSRGGQKYYLDNNFCTLAAAATAGQVAFGRVFAMYKKLGRRTRTGTHYYDQVAVFNQLGIERTDQTNLWYGKTVASFAKSIHTQDGVYLVWINRHIFCMDHGHINDWMTSNRRHKIMRVEQVTRNFEPVQSPWRQAA